MLKLNYFILYSLFLLLGILAANAQNNTNYKPLTHDTFLPQEIIQTADRYFITFEKTYFGKLMLNLDATKDETIVVRLGEKKTKDNKVDIKPGGTIRYLVDSIKVKKGKHTYIVNIPDFEPPGWAKHLNNHIRLPEEVGNIIPFRFVDIKRFSGTLSKSDVTQIAFFYPFNDKASYFKTSSEALNQVWDLCKHSMKATSFCGVYVDGDRERRPYEADAYINQLSHYAVDAEYGIARKTIDHLYEFPTWPTEWLYHMPIMLWEDYMYTGDIAYLNKYYMYYKDSILNMETNTDGIVRNYRDIIDWPKNEQDGYQLGKYNSVPNAFYYHNLILLSQMADILGKSEDINNLLAKAKKHKESFNNTFWDESSGLYIDAIGENHSSIHANIFPALFGLANGKMMSTLIPFIESKGMAVSVYGAQYLLDLLYVQGKADYAFDLITTSGDRGWLNMLKQGSTITLESWDANVKSNLDWNHAWGAAPGNIIARRMFGIRPLEAGFRAVTIEPQLAGLTSGKFTHPTINGDVTLSFERKNGKLYFTIKNAMPAQFIVPVSCTLTQIKMNGKKHKTGAKKENQPIALPVGINEIKLIIEK